MSAAPTRNLIVRHAAVGALTVIVRVPLPSQDDRAVCAFVRWLPARPASLLRCEVDELQRVRAELSATVQRATGVRLELPEADGAVFDGRIEIEAEDEAPKDPPRPLNPIEEWNALPKEVIAALRLAPLPTRSAERPSVARPLPPPPPQPNPPMSPVLPPGKK